MLLRVLERVSYLDVCDKIIVSTTLKEKDDEIVFDKKPKVFK